MRTLHVVVSLLLLHKMVYQLVSITGKFTVRTALPKLCKTGGQAGPGGWDDDRGAAPEHGGIGQSAAARCRATGPARAVTAAVVEESVVVESALLEPWARQVLADASRNGQTVVLSLDQTDLEARLAVLMRGLVMGDRALPLAWASKSARRTSGLPVGRGCWSRRRAGYWAGVWRYCCRRIAAIPPPTCLSGRTAHGWRYRLRLKGNPSVNPGFGNLVTTGERAHGFIERYLPDVGCSKREQCVLGDRMTTSRTEATHRN